MPMSPVVDKRCSVSQARASCSGSAQNREKDASDWKKPPSIPAPDAFVATSSEGSKVSNEDAVEETSASGGPSPSVKMAWFNVIKAAAIVVLLAIPLSLAILGFVASGGLALPFLVVCGLSFLVVLGDLCMACYNLHLVRQGKEALTDGEDWLCFLIRKCAEYLGLSAKRSLVVGRVASLTLRTAIDLSCMCTGSVVKGAVAIVKNAAYVTMFLQNAISYLLKATSYCVSQDGGNSNGRASPEAQHNTGRQSAELLSSLCVSVKEELEQAGSGEESEQTKKTLRELLTRLNLLLLEGNDGVATGAALSDSSGFAIA